MTPTRPYSIIDNAIASKPTNIVRTSINSPIVDETSNERVPP